MKNNLKKWISLVLAVILTTMVFPLGAFAETEQQEQQCQNSDCINAEVHESGAACVFAQAVAKETLSEPTISDPVIEYKVEYNSNFAPNSVRQKKFAAAELEAGLKKILSAEEAGFSNAQAEFSGWALTETGSVQLHAGDAFRSEDFGSDGTLKLFAVWGADSTKTYQVVYHANNGGEDVKSFLEPIPTEGLDLKSLNSLGFAVPKKKVLAGWSKTESGVTDFIATDKLAVSDFPENGVLNLYAVWVSDKNITNGQYQSVNFYLLKSGATAPGNADPDSPSKYEKVGVGTIRSLGGTDQSVYINSGSGVAGYIVSAPDVSSKLEPGESIRWYVIKYDNSDGWHVDGIRVRKSNSIYYTVRFYGEDGEDLLASRRVTSGSSVTAPTYTLPNKTFLGWYLLDANGKTDTKLNLLALSAVSENIDVYAKMQDDPSYTIRYYLQNTDGSYSYDAANNKVKHGKTGVTGSVEAEDVKSFAGYTYQESNPATGTILADGSLVLRVYYNNDLLKPYTITVNIYYGNKGNGVLNRTNNIKASWSELVAYRRMSHYAVANAVVFGGATVLTSNSALYTHQWTPGKVDAKEKSHVLNIYLRETMFLTVNFYSKEASVAGAADIIETDHVLRGEDASFNGVLPTKAATGAYSYTFANWDKSFQNVQQNLEVYPVFAADALYYGYTVRYLNANDSTVLAQEKQANAVFGAKINAVDEKITIDGYRYTNASAQSVTISALPTNNVLTLYYAPEQYQITYVLRDSNAYPAVNPNTMASYTVQDTLTLREATRSGFTFAGWTEKVNGTFVAANGITKGSSGDRTFYAGWTAVNHTVQFLAGIGGALDANDTQRFTAAHGDTWESAVTVPDAIADTNSGYEFIGWDPLLPNDESAIESDLTFTAQFRLREYTVRFLAGEHGGFAENDVTTVPNVIHGTKWSDAVTAIPSPIPAENYYFSGWNATFPADSDAVTSNLTFTATFKRLGSVTIKADSQTVDYNGAQQSVTTFCVYPEDLNLTVSNVTAIAAGKDVGKYATVFSGTPELKDASGADVTKQYKIKMEPGELTIRPQTIYVTIADHSKDYLAPDPVLTEADYKYSAAVAGEAVVISGVPEMARDFANETPSATAYQDAIVAGTIALSDSTDMTNAFKKGNYQLVFKNGSLMIDPAALSITASDVTQLYDGALYGVVYDTSMVPTGTVLTWGYKIDGTASATGKVSNVKRDTNGFVEAYSVVTTVSHPYFKDVVLNNSVTITPATLNVSPISAKETYGVRYDRIVLASPQTAISTAETPDWTQLRVMIDPAAMNSAIPDAGLYENAVVVTGTLTAVTGFDPNNYTISLNTADLLIERAKSMTVTAKNMQQIYNAKPMSVTAVASNGGVVLTDAEIRYQDAARGSYSLTANAYTDVGTHMVYFAASHKNYETVYGSAVVEITPAPLTLRISDETKTAGQTDPTPRVLSLEGVAAGEDAAYTGSPAYDRDYRAADAGAYRDAIGAGTVKLKDNGAFRAANYEIKTVIPGTLRINEAPVLYTVTFYLSGGTYGTNSVYRTNRYIAGATVGTYTAPAIAGYVFDGWTGIPGRMPAHDVAVYGAYLQQIIPETPTPTPAQTAVVPTETPVIERIVEENVALAGPVEKAPAWALLNLLLAVLTFGAFPALLIGYVGKRKRETEAGTIRIKKKGGVRFSSVIPAVGAVIAFLLTEDMRQSMVLVDQWTLLMAAIALIQTGVSIFSIRSEKTKHKVTAE